MLETSTPVASATSTPASDHNLAILRRWSARVAVARPLLGQAIEDEIAHGLTERRCLRLIFWIADQLPEEELPERDDAA